MLEVTKENFESEVLQAEGYVFVDFFGDGCVPCAALMPHVHALADKYADSKLKFCCMNTTKARRLAIKQGIMGLPVMAIYKDGAQVESLVKEDCTVIRFIGERNKEDLVMSLLNGKKVIIIGDRDGVPGPAIEECVKTAGAEVVYSSTECFV